jgi:putative aminopeptidase FrvX
MDLQELLTELCQTPGLSGYEGRIREVIARRWAKLTDEQETDALGSLIATRHGHGDGPRPKILITAHMDEIGLIVTKLDGAFLRVTQVGGFDKRIALGQPVIVHGQKDLPGVIGSRPPHVLPPEESSKYLEMADLVVDTGLAARQLAKLVSIGDAISFDQQPVMLQNNRFAAKGLDNRASLAVLTVCLEALTTRVHHWDVVAAATVQEEVGLRGGTTVAWHVQPDLAVVVDVSFATGNGVSDDKGLPLGEGPAIGLGPTVHPRLFDMLIQTAKDIEMDVHVEPIPSPGGTEARVVQISREGVPTAEIGIPLRNMHTPVEVVSLDDIERAGRLLAALIERLETETMRKITFEVAPEAAP